MTDSSPTLLVQKHEDHELLSHWVDLCDDDDVNNITDIAVISDITDIAVVDDVDDDNDSLTDEDYNDDDYNDVLLCDDDNSSEQIPLICIDIPGKAVTHNSDNIKPKSSLLPCWQRMHQFIRICTGCSILLAHIFQWSQSQIVVRCTQIDTWDN